MRMEKIENTQDLLSPVYTDKTLKGYIREAVQRKLEWFRARIFGACPECHSIHIEEVYGWDKLQCKDCGCTWRQGF
jgi:hypothetical protein